MSQSLPKTKSPAANPNVTPDPYHDGSIIRKAFLLEAALNLFTIPLLTHPYPVLSTLLLDPTSITPSTVLFARLFGALVVGGLTTALLAGATNTRNGIESRRPTYAMLGMGEACLLPVLGMEVVGGGEKALSRGVALGCMGVLVGPLVWRVYVLGVRPELLGRYVEEGEGGSARGTKEE